MANDVVTRSTDLLALEKRIVEAGEAMYREYGVSTERRFFYQRFRPVVGEHMQTHAFILALEE